LSRTTVHSEVRPEVEQDERWALVLRIASSRQFAKASQLREILIYVCQRVLSDPSAVIREQEIGCNALGRKADFNPQEDNIVRVQISQVRKRLDEYFASDGKDEPVQITIPKGAYLPRFEPKQEPEPPLMAPVPVQRRNSPAIPILSAIVVVLAVSSILLGTRALVSDRGSAARTPALQDPLWSRLFGGSQPVGIVVSDSCLVMLQDTLDTNISVEDYAAGQYPRSWLRGVKSFELKSALQLLSERQYTSLGDLNISSKLMELSRQFGQTQPSLRYARHLNVRDFKTGNFIFVGSRRGIPWVELFSDRLNFPLEEHRRLRRTYFRNRSPKPGEQATYAPFEKDGALETYADIALLPNLGNNGTVLLLSGISMVDTEAAGELLTRKGSWKDLSKIVGAETVRSGYFEILVRTRAVAGAASESEIVTSRVIQANAAGR
jgi:hypothetical protein